MAGLLDTLFAKTPDLIAFDLDGTLVDSVPDIAAAVDQMRVALGMPQAGEAAVRYWVGNGAEVLVKRALADSLDEAIVDQVSEERMDVAFPLFKTFYEKTNGSAAQLYPGVRQCLSSLSTLAIPMAIVTNKPKLFTDPLLKSLGIDCYFERVIGGDCFPEKKPSPIALNHLLEFYAVSPDTCLMVGDSKSDVGAGRAAGYKVACVRYGYNHGEPIEQSKPDVVIDSLAELVQ
ncbi:MAG: phosphoglycolate phosphatase [Pseudomonadales bacterium]|nr:phosphoglycolate phosphatase [Pseudomonadales bacterium]